METVELTVEQKALADRAYKRLLSGRSLRRMKGNKDIIDLRGYDLSDVDMTLIATSSAYCELILGNNGIDEEELKRSTTTALEKRMFNLKAKNKRAYYLDRNPNGTIYYEKDYIEEPKESGYRSYHMIVLVPIHLENRTEYIPVEIQIRTVAMDCWASLDHKLRYRYPGNLPQSSEDEIMEIANDMLMIDKKMQHISDMLNKVEE